MVHEGEIADYIENRFCVRLNPEAESIDDATEMFVVRMVPKVQAAAIFGIEVQDIDTSIDDQLEMYADLHASAAANPDDSILGTALGIGQEEAKGDQCLVLRYYAKQDAAGRIPRRQALGADRPRPGERRSPAPQRILAAAHPLPRHDRSRPGRARRRGPADRPAQRAIQLRRREDSGTRSHDGDGRQMDRPPV
jgi:hypothetical protein